LPLRNGSRSGLPSFSSNYAPFGSQYGASGSDPVYKFTERAQDSATGLYYYNARYYDTTTGRFTTRDPARAPLTDPGGADPYLYVKDCPLRYTDPTGKCLDAWGLAQDLIGFVLSLAGLKLLQIVEPSYVYSLIEGAAVEWPEQAVLDLNQSPPDIGGLFIDVIVPMTLSLLNDMIQHLLAEGIQAAAKWAAPAVALLGFEIAIGVKEAEAIAAAAIFGIQLGFQLGNPSNPGLCNPFTRPPPLLSDSEPNQSFMFFSGNGWSMHWAMATSGWGIQRDISAGAAGGRLGAASGPGIAI